MKIISIANQKGGCGKTTTAINLAGALADAGRKILVIDLDPQSHATFGLGVASQVVDKSIYNVLTDYSEKRRTIDDCILSVSANLDIVPSNILLSTLEQELKDKEDAVSRLHYVLTDTQLKYDYVLIDCPPSLGFLTFNALRACELVMVPIDMSAFSLMGVGKLLGMLELIKIKINHAPKVYAVATLFDKRTKYSQTMLDEIKLFFKDQLLETVLRVSVALKKAVAKGVPVIQFDRESNGARDHLALSQEILRREEPPQEVRKEAASIPETQNVASEAVKQSEDNYNMVGETQKSETQSAEPPAKEATFAIDAPNAKEIYIVGDFNHWKMNDESRLLRFEGGRWEKRMPLAPGKYRYKFIIDGEWMLDARNDEKEQNPFGTFDSILKLL